MAVTRVLKHMQSLNYAVYLENSSPHITSIMYETASGTKDNPDSSKTNYCQYFPVIVEFIISPVADDP